MTVSVLLFVLTLAPATQPATLQVSTSGWCSPVILNVKGPVTVNCIGVDPRANARLNEELDRLKLSRAEKVRQANEWTRKYRELEKHFKLEIEGRELTSKAEEYLHQGDLDKAVAVLRQVVAGRDKQNVDNAAAHEYELGLALELTFQMPEAMSHLEEAQRLRPNNPSYTVEYARALLHENRFREASAIYDKAIPKLQQLKAQDPFTYAPPLLQMLMDVGIVHLRDKQLDKAKDAWEEAFVICMTLGVVSNRCDLPTLDAIVTRLGDLLVESEQYKQAEVFYREAFRQYQAQSKDGRAYLYEQALILSRLGYVYKRLNNLAEAQRVLDMSLGAQRGLLDQTQPGNQALFAATFEAYADLKEEQGTPGEAEAAYQSAARIYRDLAKADPDGFKPLLARALFNWGRFDMLAKRYAQAQPVYEELLPLQQRLAVEDPAEYLPDIAFTFSSLASIWEDRQQYVESVGLRQKAVDVYRQLARSDKARLPDLAAALHALAWAAMWAQNVRLAQSSADAAEEIWRDSYRQDPAAYGDKLGQTVLVQAMLLRLKKADCTEVVNKAKESMQVTSLEAVTGFAQVLIQACGASDR